MATRYKRKTLEQGPIYGPKSKKSKSVGSKQVSSTFSNTELFARSLANPMAKYEAKIPDLSCVDTACFSLEQTFDWDPTITIDAEVRPNLLAVGMGLNAAMPVIYQSKGKLSSTDDPMFCFNNNQGSVDYCTDSLGAAKVVANYSAIRLVSCGIQIEFAGGDNQNAGTINTCVINSQDIQLGNNIVALGEDVTNYWHSGVMGNTIYTSTYTGPGVQLNNVLNARDNFSGPAKFGAYYSYRSKRSDNNFTNPKVANSTASTIGVATYNVLNFEEMFVAFPVNETGDAVTYRVKIVSNFEGLVIDGSFPKQNTKPSPMDIYGLQSGVEAGIATSRLGSLSEGPTYTWKNLERQGASKFKQIVSLSQGR